MDNKMSGVFSGEGSQEMLADDEDNIVQFLERVGLILHDFEQCVFSNILELGKDHPPGSTFVRSGSRVEALRFKLGQAKRMRDLLSEVNESLSNTDNIDSDMFTRIIEIENLLHALSVSDLPDDEEDEISNAVDAECENVGGYIRKVVAKDIA